MAQIEVNLMYQHAMDGRSIYGLILRQDDGTSLEARVYFTPTEVILCGGPIAAGFSKSFLRQDPVLLAKLEESQASAFHDPSVCKAALQLALEA